MIEVRVGRLEAAEAEAVLRPVRSDLAPVTVASREVALAAGDDVERRLRELSELPIGGAAVTPAGALPCSFLIHVVIQAQDQPVTESVVRTALTNGLRRARDWEMTSVAMPPLGQGAGTLEPERWAELQVSLLHDQIRSGAPPTEVTIVVETEFQRALFQSAVDLAAPSMGTVSRPEEA